MTPTAASSFARFNAHWWRLWAALFKTCRIRWAAESATEIADAHEARADELETP